MPRRVAIVAGLRTPFVKAATVFKDLTALDLGTAVVKELVQRSEVPVDQIDAMVFGAVIPNVAMPNISREIALAAGLPKKVEAYSVSRACATSMQSLTSAADSIALGEYDVAIVGGVESMSDVPISLSKPLAQAFVDSSKGKTIVDKLKAFSSVHARDLVPVPPAIAEYSTGLTMGESAEKMAKENGISREAQDAWAHRSHSKAAAAWANGTFAKEVMHVLVPPKFETAITEDNLVRKDSTLEGYAKLKPVFDRKYGSITAGNASPLTDGAAALVIMSEEKAKALGLKPLGFLRSYAYAAVDPKWQLLQAPAFSAPKALKRAGMKLKDIDLVEIHEAFAAQVLSNLQAWGSKKFADEHLGGAEPMGEVPDEKMNPNGGSISLGHPFGATGARLVNQTLRELNASGKGTALISICAAGALGAACVLERE
ncbi:MAG: acetyl-CoA C-acyltransferase FadI [Deltaproteobacteria bacterium]|nr:acetyl-CoA C-acyltransferase FadI [Deltaproteobacteria bacterium]